MVSSIDTNADVVASKVACGGGNHFGVLDIEAETTDFRDAPTLSFVKLDIASVRLEFDEDAAHVYNLVGGGGRGWRGGGEGD